MRKWITYLCELWRYFNRHPSFEEAQAELLAAARDLKVEVIKAGLPTSVTEACLSEIEEIEKRHQ